MRAVSAHARQANNCFIAIERRSAGKPRPRARRPEASSCAAEYEMKASGARNSRDSRARSPTRAGRRQQAQNARRAGMQGHLTCISVEAQSSCVHFRLPKIVKKLELFGGCVLRVSGGLWAQFPRGLA